MPDNGVELNYCHLSSAPLILAYLRISLLLSGWYRFVVRIGCPPGASRADSRTISNPLKSSHAALPKGHEISATIGHESEQNIFQNSVAGTNSSS
jgi:hypothetical protein